MITTTRLRRIRQRLVAPLGFTISAVRGRGYVLEPGLAATDPSKAEDT
ncbi:MAG TPA: hypothetical protein VM143_05020 [Acidimicrobiales bacterium]|nr:hypothetical protein [Acidimicrobiales bacterium]